MLISEIYESRQGEGRLSGEPSVFVRTSGCNLRCTFCDTPFTSWEPDGQQMTLSEIVSAVERLAPRHIVITGGEPMLHAEMGQLTERIHAMHRHITIETAGTIDRNVQCDLMSISPKMANSTPSANRAGEWQARHERNRLQPDVIRRLIRRHDYQLKFVIVHPSDLGEILRLIELIGSVEREKVLLMPEGIEQQVLESRGKWLTPLCEEHGFSFCPRKHIEWFGHARGT
jgi:7-carboxy-7-deazaguanine synthase